MADIRFEYEDPNNGRTAGDYTMNTGGAWEQPSNPMSGGWDQDPNVRNGGFSGQLPNLGNSGVSGTGTTGVGNRGTAGMSVPGVLSDAPGPEKAPPAYKPFSLGEFQRSAGEISGRYSGSIDDFVNHIFPELSQQFQGLERFGSKGDKIRLPNGQVIDAVISAGLGGRGYNWNPEDPTSGGGYSQDPLIGQYIDRMNGLVDRLSQPQPINPVLQQAVDRLSKPQPVNATLQDAIGKLQGMFDNPGYTETQRGLMRTNLQEPLESQRAASQQRALGRASDRGLGLGSGVLEQEAQGIDMGFDRLLGEAMRQMSVNEIGVQNQQRAGAASGLAGIGQGLQGQDLSSLFQLANVGQGIQGENLQALAQALGGTSQLGMLPIQLQQAQTQALDALNRQQIPQQDSMNGLISLLMGLSDRGEDAFANTSKAEGGFWDGLFQQLPGLIGAFTGSGGTKPDSVGDIVARDFPHA